MIGQIAGWVSSLHLLRMMAEREHLAVVCSQVCIIFKHLDESLKRSVRDYEGGGVDFSLAASCKDKEWLNQPTSGGDGGSEWGVLVSFSLYGYFLEIVMSINEFNVMESDVCSGLCRKWIVGLEDFQEENVWSKVARARTWGRDAYAGEELVWDSVVVGVSRENLQLMRPFHLV